MLVEGASLASVKGLIDNFMVSPPPLPPPNNMNLMPPSSKAENNTQHLLYANGDTCPPFFSLTAQALCLPACHSISPSPSLPILYVYESPIFFKCEAMKAFFYPFLPIHGTFQF